VVEPRSNVVALRPRVNPRHPSLFDQDTVPASEVVVLSRLQGQLIGSLLRALRAHAPSPRAVDEAIELLCPGARS
jgi:hypothetical protein